MPRRAASRRSPNAPWRWPGWCRKTVCWAAGCAGWADPLRPGTGRRHRADRRAADRPHRRGRGGGAGHCRGDQFRRRRGRLRALRRGARGQQRLRRRICPHQPFHLRHRPGRAGYRDGAGLRLFQHGLPRRPGRRGDHRPPRRGEGGCPPQPPPAEDRAHAGGLRPARRGSLLGPPGRRHQRRGGRPRHQLPEGQARPAGVRRPGSRIDDPTRRRGLRSRPFDGEGMPGIRRAVVEDGVLTTWILDWRSARQLGMASTGHASRGTGGPPARRPPTLAGPRQPDARRR